MSNFKCNYHLKRTAIHKLIVLKPEEYKIKKKYGNILKARIFSSHILNFRLCKSGEFFINRGERINRKNTKGEFITYAIKTI